MKEILETVESRLERYTVPDHLKDDPDVFWGSLIDDANEGINNELLKWNRGGINPENVQFTAFLMNAYILVLQQILMDKGIISPGEMAARRQDMLLGQLEETRPMAEEARRDALRADAIPPLFGPNGKLFKDI